MNLLHLIRVKLELLLARVHQLKCLLQFPAKFQRRIKEFGPGLTLALTKLSLTLLIVDHWFKHVFHHEAEYPDRIGIDLAPEHLCIRGLIGVDLAVNCPGEEQGFPEDPDCFTVG